MIKFHKSLNDFDAVMSFDLAKKRTGFSFYNYKTQKILRLGIIEIEEKDSEFPYLKLYQQFRAVLSEAKSTGVAFFVTKERLPSQNGPHSTIATLQELAKVHAIFDLAVLTEEVDTYDFTGVHSTSVKAYFKNTFNLEKPSKEDIAASIQQLFPNIDFQNYSLDVTDSLGVSLTLLKSKWDKDIQEEQKQLQKEKKKYKTEKKHLEIDQEICRLESLKSEETYG